ncbi:hypothetical protein CYLTODRAFT_454985 [Cylindrobasidium torrendii FP15055 ss-10]|uniref:Fork-head domain-containing protein n=1 Tax=Cylindrobasidium torrendii FP15055 ss-10 TaxID=1314674 RepID=A0A0D7B8G1_9AGAR|nr:hypothetical protein CYLTODRAFT_454985 [Cylindrobasidium torrendii FP15055 ss-10]
MYPYQSSSNSSYSPQMPQEMSMSPPTSQWLDSERSWSPFSSSESASQGSPYIGYPQNFASASQLEQFMRRNIIEWLGPAVSPNQPISLRMVPNMNNSLHAWQLIAIAIYCSPEHCASSAEIRAAIEAAYPNTYQGSKQKALNETVKHALSAYHLFRRIEIPGGRAGLWTLDIHTDPFGKRVRARAQANTANTGAPANPESVELYSPYN